MHNGLIFYYDTPRTAWVCQIILIVVPVNVKNFPTVNRVNMFQGESYNNQERPDISHGKVLAMCVAILGAQPKTIRLINEMLHMPLNRD